MIQGTRVFLKSLEEEGLADRHRWLNDKTITDFFVNLGSIPLTYEQLVQWYQHTMGKPDEIHFAIFLNENDHIGGAQLKSIDWRKNRSAEFGMFIGEKQHWGKGLGTEVTKLLVNYAFQTLNLHRIWLKVDSENQAAIHCYEKAGFIREGLSRHEVFHNGCYHDLLLMSILADG